MQINNAANAMDTDDQDGGLELSNDHQHTAASSGAQKRNADEAALPQLAEFEATPKKLKMSTDQDEKIELLRMEIMEMKQKMKIGQAQLEEKNEIIMGLQDKVRELSDKIVDQVFAEPEVEDQTEVIVPASAKYSRKKPVVEDQNKHRMWNAAKPTELIVPTSAKEALSTQMRKKSGEMVTVNFLTSKYIKALFGEFFNAVGTIDARNQEVWRELRARSIVLEKEWHKEQDCGVARVLSAYYQNVSHSTRLIKVALNSGDAHSEIMAQTGELGDEVMEHTRLATGMNYGLGLIMIICAPKSGECTLNAINLEPFGKFGLVAFSGGAAEIKVDGATVVPPPGTSGFFLEDCNVGFRVTSVEEAKRPMTVFVLGSTTKVSSAETMDQQRKRMIDMKLMDDVKENGDDEQSVDMWATQVGQGQAKPPSYQKSKKGMRSVRGVRGGRRYNYK